MLCKPVPSRHPRNRPEHMVGNRLPMQIAHKPPHPRASLHPTYKFGNPAILQMMCHQRTHHGIDPPVRSKPKHISRHIFDSAPHRSLPRRPHCIRVQVDPRQPYRMSPPPSPPLNPPKHIPIPAPHIHNVHRLGSSQPPRQYPLQPPQRRRIRPRHPVHARNRPQASPQLLKAARLIHQFGILAQVRAPRKIERRNSRFSPFRALSQAYVLPPFLAITEPAKSSSVQVISFQTRTARYPNPHRVRAINSNGPYRQPITLGHLDRGHEQSHRP